MLLEYNNMLQEENGELGTEREMYDKLDEKSNNALYILQDQNSVLMRKLEDLEQSISDIDAKIATDFSETLKEKGPEALPAAVVVEGTNGAEELKIEADGVVADINPQDLVNIEERVDIVENMNENKAVIIDKNQERLEAKDKILK